MGPNKSLQFHRKWACLKYTIFSIDKAKKWNSTFIRNGGSICKTILEFRESYHKDGFAKSPPADNFINILRMRFLFESLFKAKNYLENASETTFVRKIRTKNSYVKTLMKLTPACTFHRWIQREWTNPAFPVHVPVL